MSRQLPPLLPYAAPGIPEDVYPTERYLDPLDVLRSYDQAAVDLFRIPLIRKGIRLYSKDELEFLSVQKLRELAAKLEVNDATDNKDLLVKAIVQGQQIPVVLASPSPAYSAQELVTGRREGSPMSSNIRYPIISVQPLHIGMRDLGFNRAVVRKINWIGSNKAVIQGFKPNPISLLYQVGCLATLRNHMNMMDAWFLRMWNLPVVRIEVNLGEPWGVKPIHVLRESSFSDETEYEQDAATAEKMVRHIHTITMEGWIPTPVWVTPTVLKFKAGFYDLETGALLDDGVTEKVDA